MPNQPTANLDRTADVLIVGGGVIGLSIARELALRGLRDVVVLDRAKFGREASWAAGGILGPQVEADRADDFFKMARASRDSYPRFAAALHEETGIDVELDQTGALYLGFSRHHEQEMQRRYEWQTRAGLRVEWLTVDDARRLEPNISREARCAMRFPDDVQVENRKLVEALIVANQRLGVRNVTDCEVTSVHIENGKVMGVQSSAGFLSAPIVVIAAGAWTSQIQPIELFGNASIEPVRGHMVCFKPEQTVARHVIYSSRGYLVPRRDGRLLAGSTSERVGFDKRVTNEGVESIKSMACEIAPSLESAAIVDSWAGFRPHAPDDLPVLGPAPDVEGLFYATGHYRNGILLAPITAELSADSIIDGVTSSLLDRFSPGRFSMIDA